MKRHRMEPELLSLNGQTRVKVIVRDIGDQIVAADMITLESSLSRGRFAAKLARLDGSTSAEIDSELLKIIDEAKRLCPARAGEHESSSQLLGEMPAKVRDAANAMLRSANLIDQIKNDLWRMGIAGDESTSFGVYLVGTSRLLEATSGCDRAGSIVSGEIPYH